MFDITTPIAFGKFKGSTWDAIAGTERGQGYIRWLVDQPNEGKYKDSNQERNESLKNLLLGYPQKVEVGKADVSLDGIYNKVTDHELRIAKLEGEAIGQGWEE